MMNDLAVIIPAYKAKYLKETLDSFVHQTDKRFTLYIGDDNSPEDLYSIVKLYKKKLDIHYTKFDCNIGSKHIVRQWNRCVALSIEPWVWLFSDDDLIDATCVAAFYNEIDNKSNNADVYRFNTKMIDEYGKVDPYNIISPRHESAVFMAYNLLLLKRTNSVADHIFKRSLFEECGGFVYTEYAQGADWASSIQFAKRTGMTVIPNSFFYWRKSGYNISGRKGSQKQDMFLGHVQFIRWIVRYFKYLDHIPDPHISYVEIIKACEFNLQQILIYHYSGWTIKILPLLISCMHRDLKMSWPKITKDLWLIYRLTTPWYQNLSHYKTILFKNK